MAYKNLLSPLKLSDKVTLRNRVVMAPMNTNYANPDGSINKKYSDYFIERAKGGVGLIIIAPGYIDRKAKKRAGSLLLDDPQFVPALKEFTDAIHKEGAAVLQQLNHNGRLLTSSKEFNTAGGVCIGPSAVPHVITGEIPRVMTQEDIDFIIDCFVVNARHAKMAGYDGVEIHGAHGYLINQFLSGYSNKRTDAYGGSLENRMRFAVEIVNAVRKEVGLDFIISFRLEANEYNPDGVDIEEAIVLAKRLEEIDVDLLNVTAGNTESPKTALRMFPPSSVPQGCYSHYSKAIRAAVKIPVSIMGRIASPERAEEILEAGDSDLVTIGRGLLCDAHFVNKCATGRRQELRQCIGCLQGCYEELAKERPLTCIYNPFVGREAEETRTALKKKDIWIIGAGPAGMEASKVAAIRGHSVTLFDSMNELGGQIGLASAPPGKAEFKQIVGYYKYELARLGIAIKLGHTVTVEEIIAGNPDAVILAVGSNSLMLPLPGLDQTNVISAREVLAGAACGSKVVVCGGGLVGLETAMFLANKGKKVEVIEMLDRLAGDAGPVNRTRLLQEFAEAKITALTSTKLVGVKGDRVMVEIANGAESLTADTVVLALGARSDDRMEKELRSSDYKGEIYTAGDCVRARKILDAVAEGADAAFKL